MNTKGAFSRTEAPACLGAVGKSKRQFQSGGRNGPCRRGLGIRVVGWPSLLALSLCTFGPPLAAQKVVLTNNTLITEANTNYDGADLVISGAGVTVAMNGSHAFNSLLITNGAKLTGWFNLTNAGDFVIAVGSKIDVSGLGYAAGSGPGPLHYGGYCLAGLSSTNGGGGGGAHGGNGGEGANTPDSRPVVAYGSVVFPTDFGSGGGNGSNALGGAGGGAIRLQVGGTLRIDGDIQADGLGGGGDDGGGGAGGSVWLTVGTLAGGGSISASGGSGHTFGGGGGGGRMAIEYGTNQFTGSRTALGGTGFGHGGAGTIYEKQEGVTIGRLLIDNGGQSNGITLLSRDYWPDADFWPESTVFELTASGGAHLRGRTDAIPIPVPGGDPIYEYRPPSITLARLTMTNGAQLTPYPHTEGFHVTVLGDALIGTNCGIVADGLGYAQNPYAPERSGADSATGGGGGGAFGGQGGAGSDAAGGSGYGSIIAPVDLGSGGGNGTNSPGGAGGGAIRLTVAGTLQLDGSLSANGADGSGQTGGGGSGGSLWLEVGTLTGSGLISATGGSGHELGGGGGGGRIAIQYTNNNFAGSITAIGGSGFGQGGAGTIYTKRAEAARGQVLVDNGGQTNGSTPIGYGFSPEGTFFHLTASGAACVSVNQSASFAVCSPIPGLPPVFLPGRYICTLASLTMTSGGQFTAPATITVLGNADVGNNCALVADGVGYWPAFDTNAATGMPGGAIKLNVGGTLHLDGTLTANGADAPQPAGDGGAGGSIRVTAGVLIGQGTMSVHGGNGAGATGVGGNGGQITIYSINRSGFTGSANVTGGGGFRVGDLGTVLQTNRLPSLTAWSPMPVRTTDATGAPALRVEVFFSDPVIPESFTADDVVLLSPDGVPVPQQQITVIPADATRYAIVFPQTNSAASILIGPHIQNLFGVEMDQNTNGVPGESSGAPEDAYGGGLGWCDIEPPMISGSVRDTNGNGLGGVTLTANGGLSTTSWGGDGYYSLPVPLGFTGTITPSLDGWRFLPPSRTFTYPMAGAWGQDFTAEKTLEASLHPTVDGSNLRIEWFGWSTGQYRIETSTNLFDWWTNGPFVPGIDDWMTFTTNLSAPKQFFRIKANPLP